MMSIVHAIIIIMYGSSNQLFLYVRGRIVSGWARVRVHIQYGGIMYHKSMHETVHRVSKLIWTTYNLLYNLHIIVLSASFCSRLSAASCKEILILIIITINKGSWICLDIICCINIIFMFRLQILYSRSIIIKYVILKEPPNQFKRQPPICK